MNISVCLIVKNEEDCIARALASIPPHFERIVIDTGSIDRTKQIARSSQAKVFSFPWTDDFSAARNYSISQASGDHILIMDADEVLHKDIEIQISDFIKQHPTYAASIKIVNISDQEFTLHRMIRFFPNNKQYYFQGAVHEQLYQNKQPADFKHSEVIIDHYGYEPALFEKKNKYERYLRLYEKELLKKPDNGYMLYQLGKLNYSLHYYDKAYESFSSCLELMETDQLYFPVMLTQLGYSLKELGFSKEAYELILPILERYSGYTDLWFLLGVLSMDIGNLKEIKFYFQRCLEIGETDRYTTVHGVGSYRAAYNLGVFYEILGESDTAKSYYSIACSYNYEPAKSRLEIILGTV